MPIAEPTGYLGRFQQGEEVPLVCVTTDRNGAPIDPPDVPWAAIYLDGGVRELVETRQMAATLRGIETGVFRLPLLLGTKYATAGRYVVLFKWLDQNNRAHCIPTSFTLNPGGSPDGAVIALHYLERPDSRYVMYQTDAGRLVRGRNPR